jgi:hypothetical protein
MLSECAVNNSDYERGRFDHTSHKDQPFKIYFSCKTHCHAEQEEEREDCILVFLNPDKESIDLSYLTTSFTCECHFEMFTGYL